MEVAENSEFPVTGNFETFDPYFNVARL